MFEVPAIENSEKYSSAFWQRNRYCYYDTNETIISDAVLLYNFCINWLRRSRDIGLTFKRHYVQPPPTIADYRGQSQVLHTNYPEK